MRDLGQRARGRRRLGVSNIIHTSACVARLTQSSYLGAAASILEKKFLTAAGSILTVEARHSSFIRAHLHQSPFPQPFDTPLSFNQVFSLAATFITAFAPEDPPLPFKAFPKLTPQCSPYVVPLDAFPAMNCSLTELMP